MSDDQRDFPAPDEGDEPPPPDAGQGTPTRLPNGRFGPRYCGNLNGRPRKREPSIAEDFNRILDGKTPSNSPAFAGLTLREGLILSMCLQGLTNYRAAIAVFNILASARGTSSEEETSEEGLPGGAEALKSFIEREIRRRELQAGTSDEAAPDRKKGNGESEGEGKDSS